MKQLLLAFFLCSSLPGFSKLDNKLIDSLPQTPNEINNFLNGTWILDSYKVDKDFPYNPIGDNKTFKTIIKNIYLYSSKIKHHFSKTNYWFDYTSLKYSGSVHFQSAYSVLPPEVVVADDETSELNVINKFYLKLTDNLNYIKNKKRLVLDKKNLEIFLIEGDVTIKNSKPNIIIEKRLDGRIINLIFKKI